MGRVLHMMVGLPRSGKSTKAKELGFPIVEPDAIRKALHGSMWRPEVEPMVWGIADTMVRALFLAGHNDVILDATNHTKERRAKWESVDWAVRYHVVETDEDVCVSRAIACGQDYLVPVIKRMAANFEPVGNCEDC